MGIEFYAMKAIPVKNLKSVSVTEDLCEYDRQSSYIALEISLVRHGTGPVKNNTCFSTDCGVAITKYKKKFFFTTFSHILKREDSDVERIEPSELTGETANFPFK